jgi:hypothetical protein
VYSGRSNLNGPGHFARFKTRTCKRTFKSVNKFRMKDAVLIRYYFCLVQDVSCAERFDLKLLFLRSVADVQFRMEMRIVYTF